MGWVPKPSILLAGLGRDFFYLVYIQMVNWHTKNERAIVQKLKGKPNGKGADATLANGKPFEVHEARSTNRFRIGKEVHLDLVKRKGFYVFKQGRKTKRMAATAVTKLMAPGRWWTDRKYPYKFVYTHDVFKKTT